MEKLTALKRRTFLKGIAASFGAQVLPVNAIPLVEEVADIVPSLTTPSAPLVHISRPFLEDMFLTLNQYARHNEHYGFLQRKDAARIRSGTSEGSRWWLWKNVETLTGDSSWVASNLMRLMLSKHTDKGLAIIRDLSPDMDSSHPLAYHAKYFHEPVQAVLKDIGEGSAGLQNALMYVLDRAAGEMDQLYEGLKSSGVQTRSSVPIIETLCYEDLGNSHYHGRSWLSGQRQESTPLLWPMVPANKVPYYSKHDLYMLAEMRFLLANSFSARILPLKPDQRGFLDMLERHPINMLNRWKIQRLSISDPSFVFNRPHGDIIPDLVKDEDGSLAYLHDQYDELRRKHRGEKPVFDRAYLEKTSGMTPRQFIREMGRVYRKLERQRKSEIKDAIRFTPLGSQESFGTEQSPDHGLIGVYEAKSLLMFSSKVGLIYKDDIGTVLKKAFSPAVRVTQNCNAGGNSFLVHVGWDVTSKDLHYIDRNLNDPGCATAAFQPSYK